MQDLQQTKTSEKTKKEERKRQIMCDYTLPFGKVSKTVKRRVIEATDLEVPDSEQQPCGSEKRFIKRTEEGNLTVDRYTDEEVDLICEPTKNKSPKKAQAFPSIANGILPHPNQLFKRFTKFSVIHPAVGNYGRIGPCENEIIMTNNVQEIGYRKRLNPDIKAIQKKPDNPGRTATFHCNQIKAKQIAFTNGVSGRHNEEYEGNKNLVAECIKDLPDYNRLRNISETSQLQKFSKTDRKLYSWEDVEKNIYQRWKMKDYTHAARLKYQPEY